MRALVTGADGFVGQWLLAALLDQGWSIVGAIRAEVPELQTLGERHRGEVDWQTAAITDAVRMKQIVARAKPEAVFHLAAQSFVPASREDPLMTIETNVSGLVCVLEAVRAHAPAAMVVAVGSADAYGAVHADELPLVETRPLAPLNPYAASKAAAEMIALQYARAKFCPVVVTRSFNHTGPGQRVSFAVASFARQVAEIIAGRQPPVLEVGDLSPRRDYCDVRDVVEAYLRLAVSGEAANVYNVCSGQDRSMATIVDQLLSIAGIKAEIRPKSDLMRSSEAQVVRGDPSKLKARTGWTAAIPLERTLADMLEYFARAA